MATDKPPTQSHNASTPVLAQSRDAFINNTQTVV
jgi:hypothetical protein